MPDWLPEILKIIPWGAQTYEMLYQVFCRDIKNSALTYNGHRIWFFPDNSDGKEEIFWHLTSREKKPKRIPRREQRHYRSGQTHDPETVERYPDMRRCERLNWVNPLTENPMEPEVLTWDYEEGNGTVKTYIWIKSHDFVVIMKKYLDGTRRLVTSFFVDSKYTKQDFERKYANRQK